MTPQELLDQAHALLLDFDGPVTALMPPPGNRNAADLARAALGGIPVPHDVATTTDHLKVLRYAHAHQAARLAAVEAACVAAEVSAAQTSDPSPEIAGFWSLSSRRDIPVGIVSNNCEDAARVFLARHGWSDRVATFACRQPGEVERMKPDPHLVLTAVRRLGLESTVCVFIGDSPSDVVAGRRAGVSVIGLAKDATRERALCDAEPDALIRRAVQGA